MTEWLSFVSLSRDTLREQAFTQKPVKGWEKIPIDDLESLAILGKGGFSIVRKGKDIITGEVVAVKAFTEMETLDPVWF